MQQIAVSLAALSALAIAQGATLTSTASPRSIPLRLQGGFWFGNFDVGQSENLALLIDTGSADLIVNPGVYKPSARSAKLNRTTELEYGSAQSDGCGFAEIKASVFSDEVSVAGYAVRNQTLGSIIKTPPPNSSFITQFPGQGILGLMGVSPEDTVTGGVPFFQHLCNRKVVPECRFGLALGTNGRGRQVIGGIDSSLFCGTPVTTPLYHRAEWVIDGELDPGLGVEQTNLQKHFLLDVGTSNVIGNRSLVEKLFKKLGIQPFERNTPACGTTLFGSYPCDSPPTVSFQMGNNSQLFAIEPSAFQLEDKGNNNCTATITGAELYPGWILGQSWMQGKYMDFDVTSREFTVATLK